MFEHGLACTRVFHCLSVSYGYAHQRQEGASPRRWGVRKRQEGASPRMGRAPGRRSASRAPEAAPAGAGVYTLDRSGRLFEIALVAPKRPSLNGLTSPEALESLARVGSE